MPIKVVTGLFKIRLRLARVVHRCALILLLQLCLNQASASQSIVHIGVIQSGTTAVYQSVINSLTNQLGTICSQVAVNHCPQIKWSYLSPPKESSPEDPSQIPADIDLVLTLGKKAAIWAVDKTQSPPILFTLLPESITKQIIENNPDSSKRFSGIYLDQPVTRQFQLISQAIPKKTRVGVLLSPSSLVTLTHLRAAAKPFGLEIIPAFVNQSDNLGPTLKRLVGNIDVLLSLPDPKIFNRRTIFSILLTTYHHKIPVIGFSKAYVKAGALIAVYSSPKQIGKHIADSIYHYLQDSDNKLPAPEHPKYFSVVTNHSVARSLDISIDEKSILLKIKKAKESL